MSWENIKAKGLPVVAWLWANKIEGAVLLAVFLFGKACG
jgi:hypothetical protein